MIELRNVQVLRSKRAILQDITLRIHPGEVSVIIGMNGAGKSSLVRLLSGEWKPDAGTLLWKGKPLSDLKASESATFRATVPQQSDLRFNFTVREVVEMGRFPHRKTCASLNQKRIEQALEDVELLDRAESIATTLSGGEKKRMLLARALVQLSEARDVGEGILLLDEPTAHLDLHHQEKLLERMRSYASEGLTVIAVLHDLNHAARIADQLILLHQGYLLEAGPVSRAMHPERLSTIFGVQLKKITLPGQAPQWITLPSPLSNSSTYVKPLIQTKAPYDYVTST